MVKYRFAGMTGSSSLWLGSSICFHPCFQFLTRAERHDTSGRNRNFFAGFRIAPWTLAFVTQVEIAEPRQLNLLIALKAGTDFFKKSLDKLFGFALVESQFFE